MKKLTLICLCFFLFISAKNKTAPLSYTVDEFYKKVDLPYGTLGEDGRQIDFVFSKTSLDAGRYEIEISDGPGDLYHINGTNIYLTLRGYYGYAGYSDECILDVDYYSATLYKLE